MSESVSAVCPEYVAAQTKALRHRVMIENSSLRLAATARGSQALALLGRREAAVVGSV